MSFLINRVAVQKAFVAIINVQIYTLVYGKVSSSMNVFCRRLVKNEKSEKYLLQDQHQG